MQCMIDSAYDKARTSGNVPNQTEIVVSPNEYNSSCFIQVHVFKEEVFVQFLVN